MPAIMDGTISVNRVMHNTQWVPGHFHFYLLLGWCRWCSAFMYDVANRARARRPRSERLGFPLYAIGGLVFVGAFLAAGHASVPRRFAVHLPQWLPDHRPAGRRRCW